MQRKEMHRQCIDECNSEEDNENNVNETAYICIMEFICDAVRISQMH